MSSATPATPRQTPKTPRLPIRRYIVAAASVVALGFAGYCTVASDNEIGTAAAYITGLFFVVIAYTGQVPTIKIGENQMTPAQAAVAAADAVAGAVENAAKKTNDPKAVASAGVDAAAIIEAATNSRQLSGNHKRMLNWLMTPSRQMTDEERDEMLRALVHPSLKKQPDGDS